MSDTKFNEIVDRFTKCVTDPKGAYERLSSETGKTLIGFTLGDVPRELIHSAGFIPVLVAGSGQPIGEGGVYLPSFACSLMRSTLDMGFNGAAKPLSGLVLGHICDTTRDFSGIWQQHARMDFFHDWMPPKQMKRPSSREYLLSELNRLKEHLEELGGSKVSDEALESSLTLYEKQRALLETLKGKFVTGRAGINGLEFYTVLKASMFMEPEIFNDLLEGLLKETGNEPGEKSAGRSVVLCGKVPEPLMVIKIMEEAGIAIVDDDFLLGSRLIRQVLPSTGPPLVRLADRFFALEPFPGYLYESPLRQSFLLKLVKDSGASGVIFWNLKFCEPYNFDYPDLRKAFKQQGISTLLLETELQPSGMEQLRTRLEAFAEGL